MVIAPFIMPRNIVLGSNYSQFAGYIIIWSTQDQ